MVATRTREILTSLDFSQQNKGAMDQYPFFACSLAQHLVADAIFLRQLRFTSSYEASSHRIRIHHHPRRPLQTFDSFFLTSFLPPLIARIAHPCILYLEPDREKSPPFDFIYPPDHFCLPRSFFGGLPIHY